MKHWKVKTKIVAGFSGVLVLMVALSATFAILFMGVSDSNIVLINGTSKGQELLLHSA